MALSTYTVHEYRTAGSNNNGGGFVWVPVVGSSWRWVLSSSGTGEYYLQTSGGADPSIAACNEVYLDNNHNLATQGSAGSLSAGQWDYGDNDGLGYNTIYVRLADNTDPDTKGLAWIGYGKSGGVDYSQQASAQKSASDFASDGAGTTITTASGSITADMVGNLFYVSNVGVGGTVGWYEVLTYISATQFTIDRSCGASATGMTGAIGGARALQTNTGHNANEPGHITYIKNDGTYTLTGGIATTKDGTPQNFIGIRGYNTTRGDEPTGDNRPLIACGANAYAFDNYWELRHIRTTTTEAVGLRVDTEGRLIGVKVFNSSGTSNRYAFNTGASLTTYFDCEGISTNGIAFEANNSSFFACYAHDSVEGFETGTSAVNRFRDCIADTCTKGWDTGFSSDHGEIDNCTVYNCTTGVYSTSNAAAKWTILNTIFKDNTTAIDWSGGAAGSMYVDFCNFHGNTTDVVDVPKGNNCFALDPGFTDAANGDFSVGSNMKAVGFPGVFPGGLSEGFVDLGAIQREESGGEFSRGSVT
jgi:hypothetical protein